MIIGAWCQGSEFRDDTKFLDIQTRNSELVWGSKLGAEVPGLMRAEG
jgi:hypothetical protein